MTAPAFSDTDVPPLGLSIVDLDDLDGDDPDDDPAGGGVFGTDDPEAPYGRFANGKPRKSPAGSRAGGKRPAGRRRPATPRKTTGAKKTTGPDYVGASMGIVSVLQVVTGTAGTITKDPAFRADTATLVVMGPALAQVSGDLAQDEARWASVLDRMSTGAKWSPPLVVAVGFIAQLAVNHGLLPAGLMGTRTPEQMQDAAVEMLDQVQAEQQQQMAGRMAAAA